MGFLGRVDHPAGYQASATAVGGFGPRTKFSESIEKRLPVGRERNRESVAYILNEDVKAVPGPAFDAIGDFVDRLRERDNLWAGRNFIPSAEVKAYNRKIRPEVLQFVKEHKLDIPSKSHRTTSEMIVDDVLAEQVAKPDQIVGIVYDGPLTKILSKMRQHNRMYPIYDSSGNIRLDPLKRELFNRRKKP